MPSTDPSGIRQGPQQPHPALLGRLGEGDQEEKDGKDGVHEERRGKFLVELKADVGGVHDLADQET